MTTVPTPQPELPVQLPPGVSVGGSGLRFSDQDLQAEYDRILASVPEHHKEVEFEVRTLDGGGIRADVIGIQRFGGGWDLSEVLDLKYRAGEGIKTTVGINARWSG